MLNTWTIRGVIFALFPQYDKTHPEGEEMVAQTMERLRQLDRERPEVILMPEPENIFDPKAVRAWCDGHPIGYVAHEETAQASLMFDTLHPMVPARIVQVNVERKGSFSVMVELPDTCLSSRSATGAPSTAWQGWKCTVPPLALPDAWKDCRVLEFQIDRLLATPGEAQLPTLKKLVRTWIDKSLHDFSVEAMQTRKLYATRLRALKPDELEALAKKLDKQYTAICSGHRMTYRMQWWKELQKSAAMTHYWNKWRGNRKEDNLWRDLYEVDLQLRRMPDDFYTRIGDLQCLFSAMRYRDDVHRTTLWQVLTLLLLRERICHELGIRMQPLPQEGYGIVASEAEQHELRTLTDARLAQAVAECQSYFWAQSSWAVVFCVCRDCFGVADNVSAFEKRIAGLELGKSAKECPPGTIHSAFSNNPYLKKHIDKWDEGRHLQLARKLKSALEVE